MTQCGNIMNIGLMLTLLLNKTLAINKLYLCEQISRDNVYCKYSYAFFMNALRISAHICMCVGPVAAYIPVRLVYYNLLYARL